MGNQSIRIATTIGGDGDLERDYITNNRMKYVVIKKQWMSKKKIKS